MESKQSLVAAYVKYLEAKAIKSPGTIAYQSEANILLDNINHIISNQIGSNHNLTQNEAIKTLEWLSNRKYWHVWRKEATTEPATRPIQTQTIPIGENKRLVTGSFGEGRHYIYYGDVLEQGKDWTGIEQKPVTMPPFVPQVNPDTPLFIQLYVDTHGNPEGIDWRAHYEKVKPFSKQDNWNAKPADTDTTPNLTRKQILDLF